MTDISTLKSPYTLGDISLKNRSVMAPLTRSRATGNIPNDLMATYYAQRAVDAGLIITEGTAPDANGVGYARIPGVFNDAQVQGWKKVTKAVHDVNGKIFIQLMHTGRVSHPLNMADGARILAPSAIAVSGEVHTDAEGSKPYPVPEAMSEQDIEEAIEGYVNASRRSIEAGFDGVELHSANGYLMEQFLNVASNKREDAWGGLEGGRRFVLEVARRVVDAIGAGRTGIRLSPYGVFNDTAPDYEGIKEHYITLVEELNQLGLVYLHLLDHSAMGTPPVPKDFQDALRKAFDNTTILCGGYDGGLAEQELKDGRADLVAFGRPYLTTPDLLTRYERDTDLNAPRQGLFYTPGAEGYTDYPASE